MSHQAEAPATMKLSAFGDLLVTRDQGEPVRSQLMSLLQEHRRVEIDLDGVEAYTPSFVDEVLGKCMSAIGADQFRKQITLVASSAGVRKLVNLVLSNRAAEKEL
jgi:hypothetical protein